MGAQMVINQIRNRLKDLPGVIGVVLGGSRARGIYRPNSDIDIGIYYDQAQGFDINELNKISYELDDDNRKNLISNIGEWGQWINGGGWLKIRDYHVDFILRDINRVEKVIDDCLEGNITTNYQAGHPHGFLNVMYMGEISLCRILVDTENQISNLNSKTFPYPKIVKDTLTSYFIFEAEFSLNYIKANLDNNDLSYVVGHAYRAISCLNQVIFAMNQEYCINEKGALAMTNNFETKPESYKSRAEEVFHLLSYDGEKTKRGVEIIEELIIEVRGLLK